MIPANAAPLAIALLGLRARNAPCDRSRSRDRRHYNSQPRTSPRRRRPYRRRLGTRSYHHRADCRRRDHRFQNCDPGPARARDGIRGRSRADSARRRRSRQPGSQRSDIEFAGRHRNPTNSSSTRTHTLTTARRMYIRTFTLPITRVSMTRRIAIIASRLTYCRRSQRGGRC